VTLRRYSTLRPSRGTTWPVSVQVQIRHRDVVCVGPRIGMPGECWGGYEIDHIRASGAIGKKSPSTVSNGVLLCSIHHREKTLYGRQWRPKLIAWIEAHS
jgi:hypothetical protein